MDYYRFAAPRRTRVTANVMTVMAWTTDGSANQPRLTLWKNDGTSVAFLVLVNADGTQVIQVADAQSDGTYLLAVDNAGVEAGPASASISAPRRRRSRRSWISRW